MHAQDDPCVARAQTPGACAHHEAREVAGTIVCATPDACMRAPCPCNLCVWIVVDRTTVCYHAAAGGRASIATVGGPSHFEGDRCVIIVACWL